MIKFGTTLDGKQQTELRQTIERLEGLVNDLKVVLERGMPKRQDVDDAPVLDLWSMQPSAVLTLRGLSSGHPLLPGRTRGIQTSPVWLLSEELGLARTLSRWYVLDRPNPLLDETQILNLDRPN